MCSACSGDYEDPEMTQDHISTEEEVRDAIQIQTCMDWFRMILQEEKLNADFRTKKRR